jgi:hypothetical protein
MKQSKNDIKTRKHRPSGGPHEHGIQKGAANPQPRNPAPPTQRQFSKNVSKPRWPRWLVIVLCVVFAGGGTWALGEFVIFSKLPPELVGKWEVLEGKDMKGAIFDFSRFGSLEAHLPSPDPKKTNVLQGSVSVEDKKLFITTQNPRTKQDETRSCLIRELTPTTLTVEFEKGEIFKMLRVR